MQERAATKVHGEQMVEYEAPTLYEVGGVYELTLTGGLGGHCFHDKKWGGSDGVKFLNITIPISSC